MSRLELLLSQGDLRGLFIDTLPQEKYKKISKRSYQFFVDNGVKVLSMYKGLTKKASPLESKFL